MIYKVTAKVKLDTAAELLRKLQDGTIAQQKPDGQELVASMNRAVVSDSGVVQWSEGCHCDTPLAHERATVLDLHFDEIATELIEAHEQYEGRPLLDYLGEPGK